MTLVNSPQSSGYSGATRSDSRHGGRWRGFTPLVLALVVTLVLGGASVARAVTVPPLDAHTDLQFSLDGSTWADAPELVLGAWGCDLSGEPVIPDPDEAIGGTPGVDPCAMAPGEYIDRTYYVRNGTNTGRAGLYEVGIGDFMLSGDAEFDVSTAMTGATGTASETVTLFGADTPQAAETPARETRLASLELAPGASAKIVDTVAVPASPQNYEQDQSVSPRIWVSFSDIGVVDTDGVGLPNNIEGEIGTDPADKNNPLPDGTVGKSYGPENFLPVTPAGTTLSVDTATLPPGMTVVDGILKGTPMSAGVYDIGFNITMPGGAEFTSIRRVVIHPSGGGGGGGSSDLPDILGPIIVGGVIGVIVGIVMPGMGSVAGSLGSATGGSLDGLSDAAAAASDSITRGGSTTGTTTGTTTDAGGSTTDATAGQVPVENVTPREGSPSDEWARANSEVRSSLPTTGVGVVDLLMWALTAAAAGTTLILFARRRRTRDSED